MKGLAITNIGIEDITSSEIKGITNKKTIKGNGVVIFEAEKFEDFFRLCYKAQSARKVLLLLGEFKIKNLDDIRKQIQKTSLKEWIGKDTTFAARCICRDSDFSSQEIEPEIGGFIFDALDFKPKVDLTNPDITFFAFIDREDCYLGIDFSGNDLGKREYRIFTGAEKLKPTVAYALVMMSGFKDGEALLDPFCGSGTIAIEAALYAKKMPVNFFNKEKFLFLKLKRFEDYDFEAFFDKENKKINKKIKSSITAADPNFQAIYSAKKNAKIAGVEKDISFSRKEPKWLDIKFKQSSIDRIVSFPPQKSRILTEKNVEKLYNELFYQADYILKKGGTAALLLKDTGIAESAAKKYNFKIKQKQKIMQGREEFVAVVFSKPL